MMKDILNKKFGRLTTLRIERVRDREFILCACECGNESRTNRFRLLHGQAKSCGCLRKDGTRWTHGRSRTRLYKIWNKMIERCENEALPGYARYGGRGIKLCKAWREDFETFAVDMGEPPEGFSIDRIDNDKGYFKENCRWANTKEQARNRRSNVRVTFRNETKTISQWAEALGMKFDTLWARIRVHGWSVEKALTTPVRSY